MYRERTILMGGKKRGISSVASRRTKFGRLGGTLIAKGEGVTASETGLGLNRLSRQPGHSLVLKVLCSY